MQALRGEGLAVQRLGGAQGRRCFCRDALSSRSAGCLRMPAQFTSWVLPALCRLCAPLRGRAPTPHGPPTLMPRCCMRFSRRSLSSGKGMMGRATRLVSSRKILVGEKGMAYRKVGSLGG